MKYTCVIWDFNGTIFDDVRIGIESINVLLERRGLPSIDSEEQYKSSFMFPIIEWYRGLGFNFEKEDYSAVAVEWVEEYLSREHKAGLVDGVADVLKFISDKGIRQVIISAAELTMLKRQLSELKVKDYFTDVVGLDNVHAAGKTDIAQKWREENPDERLLFIGDTDHDCSVAKAIGADCILVSAGHQSYDRLLKYEPKLAVVRKPEEIIFFL